MRAIPLSRRLLLIGANAVFGALIGPLNFLGTYLIIGMLVADPGNLLRAPAALSAVTAGLLSTPSLFLTLPALLATLLLAPPFVRLIERIEAGDPRNARLFSSVAGIGFGFVASFLTGFFIGLGVLVRSVSDPQIGVLGAIAGAFFTSFLAGLLASSVLLPALVISGSLFGLFNRFAVRRLSIQVPTPIEA